MIFDCYQTWVIKKLVTFYPMEFSVNYFLMKLEPFLAKILVPKNLFNTVVYGVRSMQMIMTMHNL